MPDVEPVVAPVSGQDVSQAAATDSQATLPQAAAQTGAPARGDGGEPPAWVRQRIAETTKRAQVAEQKYQQAVAQAEQYQRQIQALTGAKAPDQHASEKEELRALMVELFPGLGDSSRDEELQTLRQTVDFINQKIWSSHADTTVGRMLEKAKGGFKRELTPEAQTLLHMAFSSFVQMDPERSDRYLAGDDTVVDEFYTLVDKGIIQLFNPAQAAATVGKKVAALPKTGAGATLVSGNEAQEKAMEDRESKDLMDIAFEQFKRAR